MSEHSRAKEVVTQKSVRALFELMRANNASSTLQRETKDMIYMTVRVESADVSGMVQMRLSSRGSECVIEYITAKPEGSGLATIALKQLESAARTLKYQRMIADTAMTGAQTFWKNNGYSIFGPSSDMSKELY